MVKKILIIDPRNVIRRGGNSVLIRHTQYNEALKSESLGSHELAIYDRFGVNSPEAIIQKDLEANHGEKNLFLLTIQLIVLLRKDKAISLMVSGDPWISAIVAIVARIFSKAKIPLQIQVHGDIGNTKWKIHSPFNFIKYLLAFITLKAAENIRTVGQHQSLNLINTFHLRKDIVSIIPVQTSFIDKDKYTKDIQFGAPRIGFVGRIQKERGYKKLIWILEILSKANFPFSVAIIGDGPGLNKLKKTLDTKLPQVHVTYSGWVDGELLVKEFDKIDIMISTAEFESYGRAIREAEMLGIPVLAIRSSGVLDAASDSKKDLIQIIEQNDSPSAIIREYTSILYKISQFSGNHSSMDISKDVVIPSTPSNLAKLWLSLHSK